MLDAIIRGDYEEIEVRLRNPTGALDANEEPITEPRNITSDKLIFTAKLNLKDTSNVFRKTSDDPAQIEKIDAVNGIAVIKIQPTDTVSLVGNKTLKCTMEVIDYMDRPSTSMHELPVTWRNV